jgi:hypothetical protein
MFAVADRTNGDRTKLTNAFNELKSLGLDVRISEMTVSAFKS